MRDDLEERVVEREGGIVGMQVNRPMQLQVDRRGLRAFEVDKSFVHVHTFEVGPQGGT